jgi:excisionase family DNA binding protein
VSVEPATYTLAEAAAVLGIAESTAYALNLRGEFPVRVVKIGNRYRVPRIAVDQFLNPQEVAS